jgi:hypothetical protein
VHVCVYLAYWFGAKALRDNVPQSHELLLTQPEFREYSAVPFKVSPFQVAQEASSLADEFQESSSAVMIFFVCLEVLGEFRNPTGEESDLNFRSPGVLLARAKLRDNFAFAFSCH